MDEPQRGDLDPPDEVPEPPGSVAERQSAEEPEHATSDANSSGAAGEGDVGVGEPEEVTAGGEPEPAPATGPEHGYNTSAAREELPAHGPPALEAGSPERSDRIVWERRAVYVSSGAFFVAVLALILTYFHGERANDIADRSTDLAEEAVEVQRTAQLIELEAQRPELHLVLSIPEEPDQHYELNLTLDGRGRIVDTRALIVLSGEPGEVAFLGVMGESNVGRLRVSTLIDETNTPNDKLVEYTLPADPRDVEAMVAWLNARVASSNSWAAILVGYVRFTDLIGTEHDLFFREGLPSFPANHYIYLGPDEDAETWWDTLSDLESLSLQGFLATRPMDFPPSSNVTWICPSDIEAVARSESDSLQALIVPFNLSSSYDAMPEDPKVLDRCSG